MTDNNLVDGIRTSSTSDVTTAPPCESNGMPEKLWLFEENIKQLYELDSTPDRKTFLDDFFNYRKKHGLFSKIPVIARRPLDVYALYCIVQKYGGFESTMKNRMWSQIARELDLPRTMTSGAFTLKLKYIRLLYQFECYKCNKPINQAILYNESMTMPDNKEQQRPGCYDDHVEEYNIRNQYHPPPREEYDDYKMMEKEKIYREALRRSTEKEFVMRQEESSLPIQPHPNTTHTPLDERTPPPSTLPYTSRYRSPPDKPTTLLKRPFHLNDPPTTTVEDEEVAALRRQRGSTTSIQSHEDFLRTFSVDFFEVTDDLVTIKVRLNDERYEGVLKCC